ncbi:hypothetical protein XENTR_v10014524 [Xenopus tropicalis]|nr:hypothetical protein XENTR_v10014524 [Xenopus tropicalis]
MLLSATKIKYVVQNLLLRFVSRVRHFSGIRYICKCVIFAVNVKDTVLNISTLTSLQTGFQNRHEGSIV